MKSKARLFWLVICLQSPAVQAASYDPDVLFPERDGWLQLTRAPRWEFRLPAVPPASAEGTADRGTARVNTASGDGVPDGSSEATAGMTSADAANPDAAGGAPDGAAGPGGGAEGGQGDSGADNTSTESATSDVQGGTVAVVGSGDGNRAQRQATSDSSAAPAPPAVSGVRYRVLDAGDDTPPTSPDQIDREHVYLRATAKDLAGNPIGPEGRASDEDERGFRRFEWNVLPTALAMAVEQMPYHARWEVFVPVSSRPAGKGGAYRILRSRALVFDVEREAPPAPAAVPVQAVTEEPSDAAR